jgi:SAM-dependent methyltransferase
MDLWALCDLCTPWCIFVAATLRIADHILAGNADIDKLATAAGADTDALLRMMRYLASKGIFEETAPGRFAVNEAAKPLLNDGMRLGTNLDSIGGRMAYAWGTLLTVVRTGKPAYDQVFGRPFWDDLEAHPEIAADFDALMSYAGHGVPDPEVLLDPSGWQSVRTVVDVGGGTGALLAEILRAHPHVRGILVDLPRAVERSRELFVSAGVSDRVTAVGQSFFDALPPGADIYLLKSVLSDWPDREATAILARCAEAARPNGRVIAVSGVTPEPVASPELLMLILVGGKNRTLPEFNILASDAGLRISASGRHANGRFLVECRPV